MVACLILLSALLVVGVILRLLHREDDDTREVGDKENTANTECCGTHAICEKTNSLRLAPIEYYDDEELDVYAGRLPDDYTEQEEEEFREIMMTLRPEDVEGWRISLEQRGIMMPLNLRDEYIILLDND